MVVSRGGGLESETTYHFGAFHHATMGSFDSLFFFFLLLWVQAGEKTSLHSIIMLNFVVVMGGILAPFVFLSFCNCFQKRQHTKVKFLTIVVLLIVQQHGNFGSACFVVGVSR